MVVPDEPPRVVWYQTDGKSVWVDIEGLKDLARALSNQLNDVYMPVGPPAGRTLMEGAVHSTKVAEGGGKFREMDYITTLSEQASLRANALASNFIPGGMKALHKVAQACGGNFKAADQMAANSMKSGADLWDRAVLRRGGDSSTSGNGTQPTAQDTADAERINKELGTGTTTDTKGHNPDNYGGTDGDKTGQVDVGRDDENMGGPPQGLSELPLDKENK